MRPIKLVIEGLNSFTDAQTVDFAQLGKDNIFCISGVTGSGKTTILDAVILSLYKNMKYRGNLEDYINLRYQTAKINFVFELDGEEYCTERTISRKGKNTFVLRRDGVPVCEGDDAYELLKEKIGLDAEEFTNVVVLQQGKFAKFLTQKKAERVQLINKLFSLERFEGLYTKFRILADENKSKLDACEKALETFEGVTEESVKNNLERLAEIEKQVEEKKRIANELIKEKEQVAKAYELCVKQKEIQKYLLDADKEILELKTRERNGMELTAQLLEKEKVLIEREKGRDALVEKKTTLMALAEEKKKLDEKLTDIEKRRKTLSALSVKAREAREEYEKKNAELVENDKVIERLRTLSAVASIHAGLSEGDECPVCGGVYHAKEGEKESEIAKKLSERVKTGEVLKKSADSAKDTATTLEATFTADNKRLLDLEKEWEEQRLRLAEKGVDEWEKTLRETEEKLRALTSERAEVDKTKADYEKTLASIREKLTMRIATVESKRQEVQECVEVTKEQVEEINAKANEANEKTLSLVSEVASLKERVERDKADLEKKKTLTREKREYKSNYEKYESMRTLFRNNEFSMFVTAEYIKEFTISASVQLGMLTGGKYSLSYEEESGDFYVTDFLLGNEKRKITTLSGGETFLASLSLAVAISKELSKSKSYDFFFIDEGFGTLSPDALELVTNALTTLSRDCLVGIITHRNELIERLPCALKVEGADGENGSRVSVVG